jgi:hypothetical protein
MLRRGRWLCVGNVGGGRSEGAVVMNKDIHMIRIGADRRRLPGILTGSTNDTQGLLRDGFLRLLKKNE